MAGTLVKLPREAQPRVENPRLTTRWQFARFLLATRLGGNMNWFYATKDKTQAGPVDEATLAELLRSGTITQDTLIWKEGMDNWKPYSSILAIPAQTGSAPAMGGSTTCSDCGQTFPSDQVVAIGGRQVCAGCKPLALQRFQESGSLLSEPMEVETLWAKVLERGGKFQLGEALSGAWKIYSSNFGPCLGVTLLAYLITGVFNNIPFIGAFFAIPMFFCVQSQMMSGLVWYFVRQVRGGQATLHNAFDGFRRGFGQQALFMLFYGLTLLVIVLPAVVTGIATGGFESEEPSPVFFILLFAAFPFLAYFGLRWFFTSILILDKGLSALDAMKLSARAAHRNFGMLIVLFIISFALAFAGLAALCVGLIFVGPYIVAVFAHTYNQIFGQEGSIEKV
jgi:hypothetical protein